MIYGYARVSTEAHDLTSQLAQLKAAGCEKVFREKLRAGPLNNRLAVDTLAERAGFEPIASLARPIANRDAASSADRHFCASVPTPPV